VRPSSFECDIAEERAARGSAHRLHGHAGTAAERRQHVAAGVSPQNQSFETDVLLSQDINTCEALVLRFMRRALFLTVVALLPTGASIASDSQSKQIHPASDPTNSGGWILNKEVSDDFEGTKLDSSKWYVEGTDGKYKRWVGRAPSQFSPDNVRVENGKLHITTKWDPDFDFSDEVKPEYKSPYEKYTTAAVLSNNTFLYGYLEIKCKAADASITSSFWTTGKSSELDVFEFVGDSKRADKDKKFPFATHDWSTGSAEANKWKESVELDWRVADDFHVYGCEWSESGLKFYADGQLVKSAPRTELGRAWVLTQPLMIWVDSETFYWEGFPDKEDLPVDFEIEYIRVWQKPPVR
jgi:hypothetical protein